jgi:precorrin-6A synthase
MLTLSLIGIGCGDPAQLTLAAIRAVNAADLVLIPRKGTAKSDLAELRRTICADVLTNDKTRIAEFDLPVRDAGEADYRKGVDDWHDAVAATWSQAIAGHLGSTGRVALLIWGDPSLYDSSLRIARRLDPLPAIEVVPGITSIQALCAAHALPLNDIGEPFLVTTGRQLREGGWPAGTDTVVVMLDGGAAFQSLTPKDYISGGAPISVCPIKSSCPVSSPRWVLASSLRGRRRANGMAGSWTAISSNADRDTADAEAACAPCHRRYVFRWPVAGASDAFPRALLVALLASCRRRRRSRRPRPNCAPITACMPPPPVATSPISKRASQLPKTRKHSTRVIVRRCTSRSIRSSMMPRAP